MKTKKNHQVISSDRLDLTLPTGWTDVTPAQFRAICRILSAYIWPQSLDTILFLRLAHLRYIGRHGTAHGIYEHRTTRHAAKIHIISDELIASALDTISWIHTPDDTLLTRHDILRTVHASAIRPDLRTLRFADWIALDTAFTAIIAQEHSRRNVQPAGEKQKKEAVIRTLWPGMRLRHASAWKLIAAILWLTALKTHLTKQYRYLYSEPEPGDTGDIFSTGPHSRREAIQAQIRALTKGDITIEHKVLAAPMHRALTELDQLAREFQEIKKITTK